MDKESAVHLEAIRRALENGNAAVMVGAGFSRNAEGGDQLKLWKDLAYELWSSLNPDAEDNTSFSPALVTQLGDQYVQVFSLPALEDLLKKLIPDERVKPGELHARLLELPWSEIFTTNYDTLIERAAEEIVGQSHYTVSCREDIPQSKILKRRRIVKLHGSFPSQRPFIFTEEQYRTYPIKFAPFVNLVRQSMLENIFCLIGFSGDDPNFLQWIGWVRDMLDLHSLPIYLFTGTPLSVGQRKLLEARKITPVLLPTSSTEEDLDYKDRYRLLFDSLGKPASNTDTEWINNLQFKKRDHEPDQNKNTTEFINHIEDIFNLKNGYPGWLITPEKVRKALARNFDTASFDIKNLEIHRELLREEPYLCIAALNAYTWLQEKTLQPLYDPIALIAIEALKKTAQPDKPDQTEREKLTLRKINAAKGSGFLKLWTEVAVRTLRWAREEQNNLAFQDLKTLISDTATYNIEAHDEVIYETILYALYEGERERARSLLYSWKPSSTDSYMEVRKGALLAELGDVDTGLKICTTGLQKLRRNQRINPGSAKLLSEEAWAGLAIKNIRLVKQQAHVFRIKPNKAEPSEDIITEANPDHLALPNKAPEPVHSMDARVIEKIDTRLSELENRGFKAEKERDSIIAALDTEIAPLAPLYQVTHQFDLGRLGRTHRFSKYSTGFQNKLEAGFALLTLMDRTAIPPRVGNFTFDITIYTQAAWWIQYSDCIHRVTSIAIRTLNSEVLKEKDSSKPNHRTGWLSRARVATFEDQTAQKICSKSVSIIESLLTSISNTSEDENRITISIDAIKFHAELVSRLCLRITDPELLHSFIKRLINIHNSQDLWNHPQLWRIFSTALARCMEALPPERRPEFYTPIFELPIIPDEHNNDTRYAQDWLDTFSIFNNINSPEPTPQIILPAQLEKLIEIVTSTTPAREQPLIAKSWSRLFTLDHLGQIDSSIRNRLAEHLWSKKSEWPEIPGHRKFSSLHWISDKTIESLAEAYTKLSLNQITSYSNPHKPGTLSWTVTNRDEALHCLLYASENKLLSEDANRAGIEIIKAWWDSEWSRIEENSPDNQEVIEVILSRLNRIDKFLSSALPDLWLTTLDNNYKQWILDLPNKADFISFSFWRLSLRIASDTQNRELANEIDMELATELLSDTSKGRPYIAVSTAADWIKSQWAFRPTHTIDTAINLVKARRLDTLSTCLDLICVCIKSDRRIITAKRFKSLEKGLLLLLKDLRYSSQEIDKGNIDERIPAARYNCCYTAILLSRTTHSKSGAIEGWLEEMETDALPEIRFLPKSVKN